MTGQRVSIALASVLGLLALPALGRAQTTEPKAPPEASAEAQGDESAARAKAPAAGEQAPDFTLATLDGKKKITLSSFRGNKPVILIFGSYT